MAQASYHVPGDESDPNIRAAQAALWKKGIALEGPDTDQLKGKLRGRDGQGVHFSGPGLHAHANAWVEKVTPWLEEKAKPLKYKFSFGAIADCQYCNGPNRGRGIIHPQPRSFENAFRSLIKMILNMWFTLGIS